MVTETPKTWRDGSRTTGFRICANLAERELRQRHPAFPPDCIPGLVRLSGWSSLQFDWPPRVGQRDIRRHNALVAVFIDSINSNHHIVDAQALKRVLGRRPHEDFALPVSRCRRAYHD